MVGGRWQSKSKSKSASIGIGIGIGILPPTYHLPPPTCYHPLVSSSSSIRARLSLLMGLLLVLVIVPYLVWGKDVEDWTRELVDAAASHPWQAGAVLAALLAVDVLAPVPSSVVSTACGLALGFAAGLAASFAGMGISVLIGYLLGRVAAPAARRVLGDAGTVSVFRRLHGRWGLWALAVCRPVPVLAEASVLLAGLLQLPPRPVLALLLLANLGVSAVYAAAGAWAASADAFLPAVGAALLLPGLGMGVAAVWRRQAGAA